MNAPFSAVSNLLRASALLEERFAGELAGIHGLALKEVLLLMHLERAPRLPEWQDRAWLKQQRWPPWRQAR